MSRVVRYSIDHPVQQARQVASVHWTQVDQDTHRLCRTQNAGGTPMISVEPAATATARTASNVRWIQTPEHRTDQGAFGSRRALASAPNRETSNQATVA